MVDVGCGPKSWLWAIAPDYNPIGVDITSTYIKKYNEAKRGVGIVCSASTLPFRNATADGVFSLGLFHHLSDAESRATIAEMVRICLPGGQVVILDAVLPKSSFRRSIASWVRRADRGDFMRKESELKALLPSPEKWEFKRLTYTLNGLELLSCVYFRPD